MKTSRHKMLIYILLFIVCKILYVVDIGCCCYCCSSWICI